MKLCQKKNHSRPVFCLLLRAGNDYLHWMTIDKRQRLRVELFYFI